MQRSERRVTQREETLDKKADNLDARETGLERKQNELDRLTAEAQEYSVRQKTAAEEAEKTAKDMEEKSRAELERVAKMTQDEARDMIVQRIQKEAYHDAGVMVREIEQTAKDEAEKKARNIRTLETATGVDLIIDDTPEAVIVSAFDPIRREVARIALEKLIADGRIHPARIEEMVEKAKREVDNQIREAGEQAIFETNLHGIHHELVKLLGRMRYRTSYGQNVLQHSIEVSHLAGLMAAELGADVQLAKRAGLLHDIGKAVDHEMEGTHVELGVEMAKRYHESPEVIHCIAAHHNDIEPQTVEAVLIQAADAISAARPGARRESIENYIRRLEKLEEISNSFPGVEKSFAIQSGREVRIMVKPEDISDEGTYVLAREVAKRIENELEYPGQIKVNVIRETRCTEFAK